MAICGVTLEQNTVAVNSCHKSGENFMEQNFSHPETSQKLIIKVVGAV